MKREYSRKPRLIKTITVNMLMVIILSVGALGGLQIFSEYSELHRELESMKDKFLSSYKDMLKTEVNKVISYIDYHKSLLNERLNQSIKDRVNEADAIAANLYNKYRDTKDRAEIESMIRDALRPIRFNKGRGYYFAFNMNGVEELFADRPEMEGKDMLSVCGANGEYVVKDMMSIIRREKEGFYEYTWTKPGRDGYFAKRAYVKLLEPLGWVFGTGEYIDDTRKDIQNEIINYIEQISFGDNGYIFACQWDGTSLTAPGKGKNVLGITDSNGLKVVREMINIAKQGSGFIEYVMPRLDEKRDAPKLSYVVGVPEWKWYIGAGIYVDEIQKAVEQRKRVTEQEIIEHIVNMTVALGLLIFCVYIVALYVSRKTIINIEKFTSFFERASKEFVEIDKEEMDFAELESMAYSANKMVRARKKAETALRESEKKYRHIIENAPVGIFQKKIDGEYDYVNPLLLKQWKCKNIDELMSVTESNYECTEYSEQCSRLNDLLLSEGVVDGLELKSKLADGSEKWSSIYLHLDCSHSVINGFSLDITARKLAEEESRRLQSQLLQAQKMESVGRLAGGVAHDFNNMLSVILGHAELALLRIDSDHELYTALTEILNASERSANLTRQLLAFARKQAVNPKVLDLNDTISGMLKMLQRLIGENIELKWIPDPKLWTILIDPSQIDQILANLCVNARDSIEETGKIIIETRNVVLDEKYCRMYSDLVPGEYACMVVSDDGSGMDDETLENIFEPFFTTKGLGEGTGLGLATVYGIVKQNGGLINVYSEKGKGASFSIYLPRYSGKESVVTVQGTLSEYGGNNETILVVDDEEAIISLTREILQTRGYNVIVAESPEKAVTLLDEYSGNINLLISDVIMPGMNGQELAKRIREKFASVKCLFMSGYTANVIANRGIFEDGVQFIQKPFSMNDLLSKVMNILADQHS